MSKTLQQKADEARNMCKLKGSSMLDNAERSLAFEAVYDTQTQAEQAVAFFTEKAKSVETEPCQIRSEIQQLADGFLMKMWIEFSCQAEVILFQMAVR